MVRRFYDVVYLEDTASRANNTGTRCRCFTLGWCPTASTRVGAKSGAKDEPLPPCARCGVGAELYNRAVHGQEVWSFGEDGRGAAPMQERNTLFTARASRACFFRTEYVMYGG